MEDFSFDEKIAFLIDLKSTYEEEDSQFEFISSIIEDLYRLKDLCDE